MRRRALGGTSSAGLLVFALLVSGCGGPHEKPAATTPITKLDIAGMRLARVPFCDRLTDADVRRALGGAAASHEDWGNGDPVPGVAGPKDVGHELGCSWIGADGTTAAAWIFARPVSAAFATKVVRQATRERCPAQPAPTFGAPAVVQTCPATPGLERVRRAGLFGDSWLTCEVTGPAAEAKTRSDRWCAAVVSALDVS